MGFEGRRPEGKWARSAPYPGVQGGGSPLASEASSLLIHASEMQLLRPIVILYRRYSERLALVVVGAFEKKADTHFGGRGRKTFP